MIPNRRWNLLMLLAALLLVGLALGAPTGEAQAQDANPWLALYWDNIEFSGAPALQRQESTLSHRWGEGAPAPGIDADRFAARWTNNVPFAGGTYRFTAVSDDGIRVWIDGNQIIDNWTIHPETTNTVEVTLTGGDHQIRVDYYENTGLAVASLSWELIDQTVEETITISPTSGPAGTTITVNAGGFAPFGEVTVGIGIANSEPTTEKSVTADAEGDLQTTIALPTEANPGERWRVVALRDYEQALSGDFTVTAPDGDAEACGEVYIVRPNDWLSRIAERCNVSYTALLAANPQVANPSLIYVGQRLVMPGSSDPAAAAVSISPGSGPVGTDVSVNASGFAPNEPVIVGIGRANSEPTTSKTETTNAFGAMETRIAIPAGANPGEPWRVLVSGGGESALSGNFYVTADGVTATPVYRLRLRSGPSTNTEIVDIVPAGTTLVVEGRTSNDDWVQVSYEGQTGWLASWYSQIDGDLDEVPIIGRFTSANIYMIALDDGGPVGCGDSAVPVEISFDATQAPLTAALEQLVNVDAEFYGQSGLYNALHNSDLVVDSVVIEAGTATIRLSGVLAPAGLCDGPRIEAQLSQTALQYETVTQVDILVNGQPLSDLLDGS